MPVSTLPENAPNVSEHFDYNGTSPLHTDIQEASFRGISIAVVNGACPTSPISWTVNWLSYYGKEGNTSVIRQRYCFLFKWITEDATFPLTMPPVGWDENFFWVGVHSRPNVIESPTYDTGIIEACAFQNGSLLGKVYFSNLYNSWDFDGVMAMRPMLEEYDTFQDYLDGLM